MFTFHFDQANYAQLTHDTHRVMADKSIVHQAIDSLGHRIVLACASPAGYFAVPVSEIEAMCPDTLICCYPAQVKRLYPQLPVLGCWEGKTRTHGIGRTMFVGEVRDEAVPENKST